VAEIGPYIVLKWNRKSGTASSCMWFPPYFYFRFGCISVNWASFIAVSGRWLQVTVRHMLRDNSSVYPVLCVCNVGVLRPNGWVDQDATSYGGRPRPRRHCVRWGPSSPTERGTAVLPHSLAHVYCGQMVARLNNGAELLLYSSRQRSLYFTMCVKTPLTRG